jgi:hypothetical protein
MINRKKDLLTEDISGPGARPQGHGQDKAEPHEPPRIVRLGTVAELTLGHPLAHETDGTFPGSLFT